MPRSFKKEFLPATQATNASFFSLNRSEISLQTTILIPSRSLVIFPDDLHRLRYQYSNAIWAHVQASAVAGGRFDRLSPKTSAHSYGYLFANLQSGLLPLLSSLARIFDNSVGLFGICSQFCLLTHCWL